MIRGPLLLLLLILPLIHTAAGVPFVRDAPFRQHVSTRFQFSSNIICSAWETLPNITSITQLVAVNTSHVWLLNNESLWLLHWQQNTPISKSLLRVDPLIGVQVKPGMRLANVPFRGSSVGSPSSLLLAGPGGFYTCLVDLGNPFGRSGSASSSSSCSFRSMNLGSKVSGIAITAKGDVWIGSTVGLAFIPNAVASSEKTDISPASSGGDSVKLKQFLGEITDAVTTLTWNEQIQVLGVGTQSKFYRFNAATQVWRWDYVQTNVDDVPSASSFVRSNNAMDLWIGNKECVNVQHENMTFERIGPPYQKSLPFGNITTIVSVTFPSVNNRNQPDTDIWIGTTRGAIRHSMVSDSWHYYNGPRWLPGSVVTSISATVDGIDESSSPFYSVWIATDLGLARIAMEEFTLAKKAQYLEQLIQPRHDRNGLVSSVSLGKFGDLSTFTKIQSDNDGLWTSIYVVAQCFRYAVTKDPQAKAAGWRGFEAMENLSKVTGITGLIARTFTVPGETHPSGSQWHNSTSMPGWQWKGDASSDEVVGHMFAHPLVHTLLAETPDEKKRAASMLFNIANYILENQLTLIDVTGEPTLWGRWGPQDLNDNSFYYSERCINSLQILTYLLAAYRISGDNRFLSGVNTLVSQHQYDLNMLNQKITSPADFNFSDDELSFLPFFVFYFFVEGKFLKEVFDLSLDRSWAIVRQEKSSLWNTIFAAAKGAAFNDQSNLDDAAWTLRTWPLEHIDWPVQNSHRIDIRMDPTPDRSGRRNTMTVDLIPYDERSFFRWNGNPFELDGGSGFSEVDPSAWLLPYWMARYFGFIQG